MESKEITPAAPSRNVGLAGEGRLAELLLDLGVVQASSVLGSGVLPTVAALAAHKEFALMHARHEQGAVGMADGYARFSGQVGAAIVTHGAGFTNSLTSLIEASSARSRTLLLVPETPLNRHAGPVPMLDAICCPWVRLDPAAPTVSAVEEVSDYVRSGTGPMALVLSQGRHEQECPARRSRATESSAGQELTAQWDWEAVTDWIDTCTRPVILAGGGSITAAYRTDRLAEFADRIGAPIVTTLKAAGLLQGHPATLGIVGGLGHDSANRALSDADLIISLGASLSPWAVGGVDLTRKRVVRVDLDIPWSATKNASLCLQADCDEFLGRILSLVPTISPRSRWFRTPDPVRVDEPTVPAGRGVDPFQALRALDRCLPRDRALVLDGGHFATIATTMIRSTDPRRFAFTSYSGAIGQGMSVAAGAATALSGDRVCLVVGDSGYAMGISELDTMVRYELPVTVVVMNDGGQGQERVSLRGLGLPPGLADIPAETVAAVAGAAGARAVRIAEKDDLRILGDVVSEPGGPVVVDVRIDPHVVSPAAVRIAAQFNQMDRPR